jgi:hypothetical protein
LIPSSLSLRVELDADGTIETIGSKGTLRELAKMLRAQGPLSANLARSLVDAADVVRLRSLSIEPDEDSLLIATRGDAMVFTGDQRSRDLLAQNIEAFARDPYDPHHHMHIEYFPGHSYIRRGSAPLIVTAQSE